MFIGSKPLPVLQMLKDTVSGNVSGYKKWLSFIESLNAVHKAVHADF